MSLSPRPSYLSCPPSSDSDSQFQPPFPPATGGNPLRKALRAIRTKADSLIAWVQPGPAVQCWDLDSHSIFPGSVTSSVKCCCRTRWPVRFLRVLVGLHPLPPFWLFCSTSYRKKQPTTLMQHQSSSVQSLSHVRLFVTP